MSTTGTAPFLTCAFKHNGDNKEVIKTDATSLKLECPFASLRLCANRFPARALRREAEAQS
jgi:hypothetical protein